MNGKIGLGMIGLGAISAVYRACLDGLDMFELRAVCDTAAEKLSEWEDLGVSVYKSADALATDKNIGIVLLSVPPAAHCAVAETCINAGKSVLCEKPAALDIVDIQYLYSLAKKRDVLFRVAYHAAHAVDLDYYTAKKDSIAEKYKLGRLTAVKCEFFDPYAQNGVSLAGKRALGGSHIDSGVNALSVCDRLTDISNIRIIEKTDAVDTFGIVVSGRRVYENSNVTLEIITDWTLGINRKTTEMTFESGDKIILDHSAQSLCLSRGDKPQTLYAFSGGERLGTQYMSVFKDLYTSYAHKISDEQKTFRIHKALFM